MLRAAILVTLVGLAAAAGACSKAGEESGSKRSPIAPPPSSVDVPAELRIPVTVDGRDAGAITGADLAAAPPDFADDDRRAWRLARLLGDELGPGAVIEAVGDDGVGITMRVPADDAAPQPVLFLTRRGELVASVVRPDDPFPDYHGQGGRLRRPGDPLPRLTEPVTELVVHRGGGGSSP